MSFRVAVFSSHPIQYQAPWFSALANDTDLSVRVFFSTIPSPEEQAQGFGGAFNWDIPLLHGYEYRVIQSKSMSFMPRFARRWASSIGNELREFRPDVALLLGWHDIALVQAFFSCLRLGIPVVIRGESNSRRARPAIIKSLHRAYLAKIGAALAIGKANAEFYRNAGVQEDRIISAPYFVDNARFLAEADRLRPCRDKLRAQWGIPEGSVCALFVGKLEEKKRILDFLGAVQMSVGSGRSVHAMVVGRGVQLEEAKKLSQEMSLPVTFTGFLNQSEIAQAYAAADLLVLPSDFGETWGLVVNEAMASGLPAIVSERVGCAHDLVLDGETGLVVPYSDVRALSEALNDITDAPDFRKNAGLKARRHVQAHYTIEGATAGLKRALRIAIDGARHQQ